MSVNMFKNRLYKTWKDMGSYSWEAIPGSLSTSTSTKTRLRHKALWWRRICSFVNAH